MFGDGGSKVIKCIIIKVIIMLINKQATQQIINTQTPQQLLFHFVHSDIFKYRTKYSHSILTFIDSQSERILYKKCLNIIPSFFCIAAKQGLRILLFKRL